MLSDLPPLSLSTKIFLAIYVGLLAFSLVRIVTSLLRALLLWIHAAFRSLFHSNEKERETSSSSRRKKTTKSTHKKGKGTRARRHALMTTEPSGEDSTASSSSAAKTPVTEVPSMPGVSLKTLIKSTGKKGRGMHATDRHADSELFICTLRGHTDAVTGLAFSRDGSALATACEDRELRVFTLPRDNIYTEKALPFTSHNLRQGIQDVAFGASSKSLAVLTRGLANAPGLCFVDVSHKDAAIATTVDLLFSSRNAIGLCLRGSFSSGLTDGAPIVVAASQGPELVLHVAGAGLPLLSKVDTGGMITYGVAVSEHGRFVAAATFASDVKIYEVTTDRAGIFSGVVKVMDLKGHRKKISAVSFSPDETHAVTASEDGTIMIWNINVRYKQQEDPKLIAHVGAPEPRHPVTKLAWGSGGHIAAVCGSNLYFLDSRSGDVVKSVIDAHSQEITDLAWAPERYGGPQGAVRVVATAGADGRVRLWQAPWVVV